VLYGRRVSLHLMVQPVAAEALLGDPLASGQGYLNRCLVTWPESALGTQMYSAVELTSTPEYTAYQGRLLDLLEMPPPTSEQDDRELRPIRHRLAADAKSTWIAFHDWAQHLLVDGGALRPVAGFAAKAAEHALRIAGVLAAIDDVRRTEIGLDYLESAVVITRFYLEEALRLHDVAATSPDLALAVKLLAWLEARPSRLVPIREVYQFGPGAVRDKKTAMKLLTMLGEHGWVRCIGAAEVDGSRHREVWEVRP